MAVDLDALSVSNIFPPMFAAARDIAGDAWTDIRATVKIEFKALAKRIKEIGKALAAGQINQATAELLMKMVRNNVISAIALVTNQVLIAAEKIVNVALKVVQNVINTAIGFPLI